MNTPEPRAIALSPLALFLCVFMGSGIYFTLQGNTFGFYQITPSTAAVPALILAMLLPPKSLQRAEFSDRVVTFWQGLSNSTVLAMCFIFVLAGAFTAVAKSTGGVTATVDLGLSVIPSWFLLPGMFLITAFISTAMGTSTGTIAATAPIALGVTETAGIPLPMMAGVVLSGAMFGDNLSIISDTTIAATRSQDCAMIDKFKENFSIAMPAAIFLVILYFILTPNAPVNHHVPVDWIKVAPYLAILVMALIGINVFIVLISGILLAGIIGVVTDTHYHWYQLLADIATGIWSMHDIVILSLMLGGIGALMERAGGIKWIITVIEKAITRTASNNEQELDQSSHISRGELGIAALVASVNLGTANNTIAIIVSANAARHLGSTYKISKKRIASLLDIFSCVIQGLIPWGAQILLLGASFKTDPVAIAAWAFYPMSLAVVALLFIWLKPR